MEALETTNSIAPTTAHQYHDEEVSLQHRNSESTCNGEEQTTTDSLQTRNRKCFIPLWLYVLVSGISIPFACVVSYIIYTVSDIPPWMDDFPFISDTGIYPPASCWFTFLFFIVGVFNFLSAVIRYMQLKTECGMRRCVHILNKATLIAGCTSSIGVIIVAAFQYDRSFVIHLVGAGLAFGVACIFFILQTVMSFLTQKLHGNVLHVLLRMFKVFLNIFHVAVAIPFLKFSSEFFWEDRNEQRQKAAICEWILAISLSVYPLTLIPEVRQFTMQTKMKRTNQMSQITCCIYIE